MHICILLARVFIKTLKLFWNLFSRYIFIIDFSLSFFSHLAYIVADFSLAVRLLKHKLLSGFRSRLIVPFSMPDLD